MTPKQESDKDWSTDYSAGSHNQNQTMWFPSCTRIQQAYQSYHENDTRHPHGGILPPGTVKGKLRNNSCIYREGGMEKKKK